MNHPVTCFIIMPFRPDLEPVRDVVAEVVEGQKGAQAFRADDSFHPGSVIEQVKQAIANADFCVADVTGANPNVLWEAGYAHALNKPVIQISQDTHSLPFDIRALRTLVYSLPELTHSRASKSTTTFHTALADAVAAVLETMSQRPRPKPAGSRLNKRHLAERVSGADRHAAVGQPRGRLRPAWRELLLRLG